MVDGFLAGHPDWAAEPAVRLAPDTDGTDGFFIAAAAPLTVTAGTTTVRLVFE